MFHSSNSSKVYLTIWAFLSVVAALSGPFGTYQRFDPLMRFVFWTLLIGIAVALVWLARILVSKLFADIRYRDHAAFSSVMAGLLFLPFSIVLPHIFYAGSEARFLVPELVLITVFGSLVGHWVAHALLSTAKAEEPQVEVPRIMSRLPADKRGDLIRMTVRDHYVDVYTTAGMHSLLMRFRDATQEADTVDGFCVHRSHWVTRAAITGVLRRNGRVFLSLTDGTEVPVSRKYRPNVEEAGLL